MITDSKNEPKYTNEDDGTAEYLRAIASYGVTSVDVQFNGYGDEGQNRRTLVPKT